MLHVVLPKPSPELALWHCASVNSEVRELVEEPQRNVANGARYTQLRAKAPH